MAYVPVPKDLTQVKSRFLFGLTRRQVLFFGLGALTGVPFFLLIRHSVNTSLATMLMMLLMLPFFLLALYEKKRSTPGSRVGPDNTGPLPPPQTPPLSNRQLLRCPGPQRRNTQRGEPHCSSSTKNQVRPP